MMNAESRSILSNEIRIGDWKHMGINYDYTATVQRGCPRLTFLNSCSTISVFKSALTIPVNFCHPPPRRRRGREVGIITGASRPLTPYLSLPEPAGSGSLHR